jgi:predicted HAD superfamily Cof-like phosphohydrolase
VTNFDRVREFHEATGQEVKLNLNTVRFRNKIVREEAEEVERAFVDLWSAFLGEVGAPATRRKIKEAKEALLKELTDLKYVIEGTMVMFDWDSAKAEELVHQSNMTKTGPDMEKGVGGKVLKGPNYAPPDLKECL